MNKEELLTKLTDALSEDTMMVPRGFVEDNHYPHQFRVGADHQVAADKENEGILTENILQRFPCQHLYCDVKYEDHTSDKTLVFQLTKDAEQIDVMNELAKLKPLIDEHNIKAIKFAESPEDFQFLIDGKRPDEGEPQEKASL